MARIIPIPREDSEGHKNHVEANRGDDEYSQLSITLGSVTNVSSTWVQSMDTLTSLSDFFHFEPSSVNPPSRGHVPAHQDF